jgi:integrase
MRHQHRETPLARVNPSGERVWRARYTTPDGRRVSAGTFKLKRDAQTAIDQAYARQARTPTTPATIGEYADTWLERHPEDRSERTCRTYNSRITYAADAVIEGVRLADWPLADFRRRHAKQLVGVLLVDQHRAVVGARGIMRTYSALFTNALDDELCESNPFFGVEVSSGDRRVRKQPRPITVYTFEAMRAFASHAGHAYRLNGEPRPVSQPRRERLEPMLRAFTDTGMRLGEVLPLRRADLTSDGEGGHVFVLTRTVDDRGRILQGTKNDHGETDAGRIVPCTDDLADLISAMPRRIDTPLLFPTPSGTVYSERNFYRDVWNHARQAAGMTIRPHECRHSYVSFMRAAGINDADLALAVGDTVQTMLGHYTHAIGGDTLAAMRQVVAG